MSLSLPSLLRPYVEVDFTRMTFDPRVTFARSSTGTYFDASGAMQVAAIDAPRIGYDPATLELRGLLVEQQSTNMLTYSTTTTGTVGVIGSGGALPTGWGAIALMGLTAEVLATNIDAALGGCRLRVYGTATSSGTFRVQCSTGSSSTVGSTYSTSQFARLVGGTAPTADFGIDSVNNSSLARASSGHIVAAASLGAARLFGSPSTSSSATLRNELRFTSSTGAAYDFTVEITGPQIEAGSLVTSYIPTTATQVTRAADNVDILTSALRLDSAQGGFYAEYTLPYASRSDTFGLLVLGSNNAPAYYNNSTAPRIHDGTTSLTASAGATPFTMMRVASSWGPSGMRIKTTGGTVQSVSFDGSMTSDGNPARIGRYNYSTTTQQLNGWIRRLRVWRTELGADAIDRMVP